MKRLPLVFGFLGTFVLTASLVFVQQTQPSAQAQGGGGGRGGAGGGAPAGPPMPTNLQVLSKDMTGQEVAAYMATVAAGLGVQCNYCHVPPAAPPGGAAPPPAAAGAAGGRGRGGAPQLDFAADDKQEKKTARVMLKMVSTVNDTLTGEFGKSGSPVVKVECVTCHHGVAKPEQLSDILSKTMLTKGEESATGKYREMRTQFYGSQSYDFTEPVLARLAQQSLAANKVDDALAWAKLNLENYPKSAPTLVALSQAHARKGDKAAALKDVEQALAIDPMNAAAKRQLDQLKAPAGATAAPAR
jgi:hypothetical protein